MNDNKIKEKIESDLWKEFRMQDLTPSMRDALVNFVSKQVYKQTKQLKKQLEEKEKEVALLEQEKITLERFCNKFESQLSEKENALEASERLNAKHVGYIEKLESELNEYKEKAILWDNLKTGDKLNSLVGGDSKFCEKVDKDKIKRLESELSELKAKYKEGMINFHIEVMKLGLINEGERKWSDSYEPKIRETAEQYYTQTHGQ